MFKSKKIVSLDDIAVVSRSIPTSSTDVTLPLTIKNLPYDTERIPEKTEFVRKYVINKKDPSWYRPRHINLKKESYITMNKYLMGQVRETQYTVGEMEDILGQERSETKLTNPMGWLYDMFDTWSTKLKVLKPFELSSSHILTAIAPSSNVLNDIATMLGQKSAKYQVRGDVLLQLDITSSKMTKKEYRKMTRCLKLYQSYVDVLRINGSYDNCYINLMKQGDDYERDECVVVKPKKLAMGIQHPGMEPRIANDIKSLTFWEKQQKVKIDHNIRQDHLRNKSVCYQRVSDVEIKRKVFLSDYSDSDDDMSSSDDDTDDVHAVRLPGNADVNDSTSRGLSGRKKKKRGIMRKLSAPFRWLKKKI